MSEQQKIDPFDNLPDLVDAAGLLHDVGLVVRSASEPKDTAPQIAAVEPEASKSAEPSN